MIRSYPGRLTCTQSPQWMPGATKARSQPKPPKLCRISNNGVAMRFCRFESDNVVRYGLIENAAEHDVVCRVLDQLPAAASDFELAARVDIPFDSVRLLAPATPSKIVCIGRNYREHAKEL